MNPQVANRRRLVLIISIVILAVIVLALTLLSGKDKKESPDTSGTYIDPYSHQTISNPTGKSPETYGSTGNQPAFFGIDKLLDEGLTLDQLNNLKVAFTTYSALHSNYVKEVSIDVDHITAQHDDNNPNAPFYIVFKVKINRQTVYNAKVEYSGLDNAFLHLSDTSGDKTIFDSKTGIPEGNPS